MKNFVNFRSKAGKKSGEEDLLDDVPQIALGGKRHQPIIDGDVVEFGRFLVAEERIRYPQDLPAVLAETDLVDARLE